MKITLGFILTLIFVLSNCTNDNTKKTGTILHPNKDSELTLLMREMYTHFEDLKTDIENDKISPKIKEFAALHSAVSTEPTKAESPLYKAMAQVYVQAVQRLKESKEDRPEAFNFVIDNCMNCHKQMCPGPMVKIKKLYLKD